MNNIKKTGSNPFRISIKRTIIPTALDFVTDKELSIPTLPDPSSVISILYLSLHIKYAVGKEPMK
jgi:hypothetical protein